LLYSKGRVQPRGGLKQNGTLYICILTCKEKKKRNTSLGGKGERGGVGSAEYIGKIHEGCACGRGPMEKSEKRREFQDSNEKIRQGIEVGKREGRESNSDSATIGRY